jgi:hypothetical protein
MVTWANNHYFDFVRNWVEHVEALGISAYVVGAMDNQILAKLIRAGMPCFAMQSGLTHKDFGWGSKNFHKMVRCCGPERQLLVLHGATPKQSNAIWPTKAACVVC